MQPKVANCTISLTRQEYLVTASLRFSTLWAHLQRFSDKRPKQSRNKMADQQDEVEGQYVTVKKGGEIIIEPDGYINSDNIHDFTFSFSDGQDITESIEKKNMKNKTPVSFTKKGRTAYAPGGVRYPDGESTSSKFLLENCIIQWTEAMKSPNHRYAKDFVIIGLPEEYIEKMIQDAKNEASMNLQVKDNTANLNGHYWSRCNLDKLLQGNTMIVLEGGQKWKGSIDTILTDMKKSVVADIVFTLSGSQKNNSMDEELDLKDGVYNIVMKPTQVFVKKSTEIQGPVLQDTNQRKNESTEISSSFFAEGDLAAFAARRLKLR